MKWLDLFSGVGMYGLGLEQAGHEVIGFCEVDKFCRKILKKHWPTKPISSSIESLNASLKASLEVSLAKIYRSRGGGSGIQRCAAGIAINRSGLFWAMVDTVRMVRPRYWLMENVAALLIRGMGDVLGAVAASGYYAEWDCVGAGTVGAPHHRARIYILAHDPSVGIQRHFPFEIRRQPDFSRWENVRSVQDLARMPDIPKPLIRRNSHGSAARLHAIGNGNPPCVIREITKGLK